MNPYKVLGVLVSATDEEIKQAYHNLVKKHHPDTGGRHDDFIKVQQAYAILSDQARRREYDMVGIDPQSKEFAKYNLLVNYFKLHLLNAINGKGEFSLNIMIDENRKAVKLFTDEIKKIKTDSEIIRKYNAAVVHKRNKNSRINCFEKALTIMCEEMANALKSKESQLRQAEDIKELLESYNQVISPKKKMHAYDLGEIKVTFFEPGGFFK